MKPGIVCPNPLVPGLADCPRAAEAGAKAIVARPELFVDESFGLRANPSEIASSLSDAGLSLVAVWARRALLDSDGEPSGADHVRSCLDLADALRDYGPSDALPTVIADAGSGEREAVWPKLVEALQSLGGSAEERQVILAVRPDRASVVDRSRNAVKLLGEAGSSYVQVALDAAATVGDKDTLDAAIDRLKENIVLAFARDVKFDEAGKPSYLPPGDGLINYEQYVELLSSAPGCAYLIVGELDSAEEATQALGRISGLLG